MTNLEIYKIVRELVLVVTGVPTVIKSNPNAPSPDGEYCAISITQPVSQRGQANTKTKTIVQPGGWDGVGFDIRTQLEIDAITKLSIEEMRTNMPERYLKLTSDRTFKSFYSRIT